MAIDLVKTNTLQPILKPAGLATASRDHNPDPETKWEWN